MDGLFSSRGVRSVSDLSRLAIRTSRLADGRRRERCRIGCLCVLQEPRSTVRPRLGETVKQKAGNVLKRSPAATVKPTRDQYGTFTVLALALSALAVGLRAWRVGHGLPDFTEEAFIFRKALDMWPTGGGTIEWNPHSFVYPSLTIYLHLAVQHLVYAVGNFSGPSDFLLQMLIDPSAAVIAGRYIGIGADVLTLIAVGLIGRRFGTSAAVLGMSLVAVAPTMITTSRMLYTDSVMCALALMAVYRILVYRAVGGIKSLVIASVLVGLATGAKYPAVLLFAPLTLAIWQRHPQRRAIQELGVAAVCVGIAFICTTPFIITSWTEFVRDAVLHRDVITGGVLGKLVGTSSTHYTLALIGNVGWLGSMLFAVAVLVALRRRASEVMLLLVAWLSLFAPIAGTSVEAERYLVPIVALSATLAGVGLESLRGFLPAQGRALWGTIVALGVLGQVGVQGIQAAFAGKSTTQVEARRWCENHLREDELLVSEKDGPSLLTFNRRAQVEAGAVFQSASPTRRAAYRAQRPFHLVQLPLIVSGRTEVHLPTPGLPEVPVYPHVVDWNAAAYDIRLLAGVDLVATSAAVRGRFEMDSVRFAEQARFYKFLDTHCERVAEFESGEGVTGPTIVIYRMTPEATSAVASVGPLDSLWWARTVPEEFKAKVESLMASSAVAEELTPGLPLWVQPLRSPYLERYRSSVNDLTENLASLNRLIPAERLGAAALVILPEDTWAIQVYTYVAAKLGAWRELERRLDRSLSVLSRGGPVPPHLMLARADALIRLSEVNEASKALRSLLQGSDPTVARAARERLLMLGHSHP